MSGFWDLTPIEASRKCIAAEKRQWHFAWKVALLHRMDAKKFPKKPRNIWGEDRMNADEIFAEFAPFISNKDD